MEVLQVESGGYQPIVMRSDKPPFDKVLLRQAVKHVVDRTQMREAGVQPTGMVEDSESP